MSSIIGIVWPFGFGFFEVSFYKRRRDLKEIWDWKQTETVCSVLWPLHGHRYGTLSSNRRGGIGLDSCLECLIREYNLLEFGLLASVFCKCKIFSKCCWWASLTVFRTRCLRSINFWQSEGDFDFLAFLKARFCLRMILLTLWLTRGRWSQRDDSLDWIHL